MDYPLIGVSPSTMKSAELKMGRAKATLVLDHPFFASFALDSKWHATTDVPTQATDGKQYFWNPNFTATLAVPEVLYVQAHEICHVFLQHCTDRFKNLDQYKVNYAADVVINQMLIEDKIGRIPACAINRPDLYLQGGKTVEGVYAILPDIPEDKRTGAGYGAAGAGPLDQIKYRNVSEAQAQQDAAEMKIKIAQAVQTARMSGKLPGSMKRLLGELLKPVVDWRHVLRDFVTARTKSERSWSRLARRHMGAGVYLPSQSGERMGELAVAIDCSGSCWSFVERFASELRAIVEDVGPSRVHVIYFDTRVMHVDVFEPDDTLNIVARGGGGTTFRCIFDYLADQQLDIEACVVLTDGLDHDFGPEPTYPVLWTTTNSEKFPWGQVVKMKTN